MTLEEAYSHFKEVIKKNFPDLHFPHTGYSGGQFHAELATENKMFFNTPYFYKEELSFVHWTTIDKLLSILNNREFRLYNLHNSKDETEFNFAAKELGIQKEEADFYKKYYYTFSFCKKENLYNKYLWEEYGKKFSGVAIEFSIINDPLNWDKYMISNVHYNVPDSFKAFQEDIFELKQHGINFQRFNIGKLIGFHKQNDFYNENEIRIATYFPYNGLEEYLKFAKSEFRIDKTNNRNRVTNYISLPLWVDNNSQFIKSDNPGLDRSSLYDEEYFIDRPKIMIKNIYFGEECGIENSELYLYTKELTDIIRLNLGYRVELELNLFASKNCLPSLACLPKL
jgi:hypothetical protein